MAYSPVRYLIVVLCGLRKTSGTGPAADHIAAVRSGARADVDQIVGGADAVFIVLDHDDGVADGLQALERADQAGVVALVQADGRFIEHVADADQARADLRGQADALGFAAGEGAGLAVEREIAQADVEHETEAGADFADDRLGDLRFFFAQAKVLEELPGAGDGHAR